MSTCGYSSGVFCVLQEGLNKIKKIIEFCCKVPLPKSDCIGENAEKAYIFPGQTGRLGENAGWRASEVKPSKEYDVRSAYYNIAIPAWDGKHKKSIRRKLK